MTTAVIVPNAPLEFAIPTAAGDLPLDQMRSRDGTTVQWEISIKWSNDGNVYTHIFSPQFTIYDPCHYIQKIETSATASTCFSLPSRQFTDFSQCDPLVNTIFVMLNTVVRFSFQPKTTRIEIDQATSISTPKRM